MKILVVDDESDIREVLRIVLSEAGYEAVLAENGTVAVENLKESADFDLCIMDIMMPGLSGVDATAEIRRFSAIPILFLTAKSLPQDKMAAYSAGGDDYLVKPFPMSELLLKVEALTRRYNHYASKDTAGEDIIRLSGCITVNVREREVLKNGARIDMRDKEVDLLIYLVKNRGRCISSDELYKAVWGEIPLPSSSNNITVHILNLRRKLEENYASPRLIRTVWGRGYQID